jgi:hypothetical protein
MLAIGATGRSLTALRPRRGPRHRTFRDLAQEQRRRDALPAAQGHPDRALAGAAAAEMFPTLTKVALIEHTISA